jgi:hypothetical protein
VGDKTIRKLLGVMCLAVLGGILVACLWPFHSPRNEVTWIGGGNGLRFAYPGTVMSAGELQATVPSGWPCSIEIWAQPARRSESSTLLALHTAGNPLQLMLRQSLTDLRVMLNDADGRRDFYVNDAFSSLRPVFITISSDASGTAVYIDGALVRALRGFRISAGDCSGQLVLATSPIENDPWTGRLQGLAIYDRTLAAPEVVSHCQNWTKKGQPAVTAQERCVALYLFDEHSGKVAHNQMEPEPDLLIPPKYQIADQTFLMAFWKGFDPPDIIENIIGFIPLGFLFYAYLSMRSPMKRLAVTVTVLGGLISVTMEVAQAYLPTRQSDTTDIITNTFGTWLGVMFCRYAQGFLAKRELWPPKPEQ